MKKLIIIIALALATCRRADPPPLRGMHVRIGTAASYYAPEKIRVQAEAFCGDTLYSIYARHQQNELLLLSVVVDSLVPGVYDGGINYWSSWSFNSHIRLFVIRSDPLTASFAGDSCSGEIIDLKIQYDQ